MFGFFKRKNKVSTDEQADWSFLSADMHSHFIPGIDDGPDTMEESISLLKDMQDAGFRKVVTTPHISMDYFPQTEALIASGLAALHQEARRQGLSIEMEAAAEYMIDETLLDKLHNNHKLFTINNQYLLVEMGFVQESPLLHQAIFEIQAAGYTPILAHPERYNFYHDRPLAALNQLKHAGCLLQLNTIALSGYYGRNVKVFAQKLLKEKLYDFAGSDVHHKRHVNALLSVKQSANFLDLLKYPFLNNSL